MKFQKLANFESRRPLDDIVQTLTELVTLKKGKIQRCSQNHLSAKFGSRLMLRLFGAFVLSNYFNNQLPFEIEVNIAPVGNNNHITIHFSDTIGRFIIRDSWSRSIYDEYFAEVLKTVKEKLL